MTRRPCSLIVGLAMWFLGVAPAVFCAPGGEEGLWDLSLEELGQVQIVTPSKLAEPVAKTAATVSIIHAEDIHRAAARTVYDVLRLVPGLSVGIGNYGDYSLTVRGIHTTFSEKVLILLDGHVLNDSRSGSATFQFLDRLPVDNIDRIEVVRSPGSALYGANAMLAVINIITRTADNIGGWQVSANSEWDRDNNVAKRSNLLYGGGFGTWKAVTNLQVVQGEGPSLPVEADGLGYQGHADARERYEDFQAVLDNGSWRIAARYLKRRAGDYFGVFNVLNDQSRQQVQYGFLDLLYRTILSADTEFSFRTYLDHQDTDNYYVALPAGFIPPGDFFAWNTTGFIGNTFARESATGAEVRIDQRMASSHRVSAGVAWRRERLYDTHLLANFNPAPLPTVQDVSADYNWIDATSRDIASGYLQDLWDLNPALRLTLGARYDDYTDFGSSVNPRLGLTWQLSPHADLRLTHGSAFRAPDFVSLYIKNNPGKVGNPGLHPERAKTTELGFSTQRTDRWLLSGVLFHTDLRELIDQVPGGKIYANLGSAETNGVEVEGRYASSRDLSWRASYTLANPKYSDSSTFAIGPRHSAAVVVDVALGRSLHWQAQFQALSKIERSRADNRTPLPGYGILNTSITASISEGIEWQCALFNLLDQRYRYPSAPSTIPGDYPAAGRSLLIGLRAKL